jgi:hypothetical protein
MLSSLPSPLAINLAKRTLDGSGAMSSTTTLLRTAEVAGVDKGTPSVVPGARLAHAPLEMLNLISSSAG